MKIKCEESMGSEIFECIEDYAEGKLKGEEFGSSIFDRDNTEATATNNSRAIGALLDVLANKGLINSTDVCQIFDVSSEDIFFVG